MTFLAMRVVTFVNRGDFSEVFDEQFIPVPGYGWHFPSATALRNGGDQQRDSRGDVDLNQRLSDQWFTQSERY